MAELDIHDPKLYCLAFATAIDEFRRKLENIAGYATCPEESPLSPGFAEAEADGIDRGWRRILELRDSPHSTGELDGTGWTRDGLMYVIDAARDRALRLVAAVSEGEEGWTLGAWEPDELDALAHVIGAASLLRDLARQLELKSE